MTAIFGRVTIVGPGVIGSSVARDLKHHQLVGHLTVADISPSVLVKAQNLDLANSYTPHLESAVKDADLVILATPVDQFEGVMKRVAPHLKEGAIVSDVGSVKQKPVQDLLPLMPKGVHYVPLHPVAGSDKGGPENGKNDLFKDKWLILTPFKGGNIEAFTKSRDLWEAMGAKTYMMSPKQHDETLAVSSHAPHLAAFAMMNALASLMPLKSMAFSGKGFDDTLRTSGAKPEMWSPIFAGNREAILKVADAVIEYMQELRDLISSRDGRGVYEFINRSRQSKLAVDAIKAQDGWSKEVRISEGNKSLRDLINPQETPKFRGGNFSSGRS